MDPLVHLTEPLAEPQRDSFIDPFNHRGWLEYFEKLLPRFRYVRFVGLPSLKDLPDVPLERLYVPLQVGPQPRQPGADHARNEQAVSIAEALERFRHLVVLGDPGSGKSTLTSFLVTTFASRRSHALGDALGPLIPFPFVLRDFTIPAKVSFDQLLDQFLAERYWSSGLTRDDLVAALDRGQGLVILDGLDEIGDVSRRRDLRQAVLEQGLARFPASCWLLTSRIVGYEEAAFDQPLEASLPRTVPASIRKRSVDTPPAPHRLYLLPFDLDQIRRFAENWYAFREADPVQRKAGVESLLAAIQASPAIERLAHTPNLLQMMALIHKVYAQLPSGRALLYDRIAEAYLESIDASRKLQETSVPASRQRRWLGSLAYDLQLHRTRAEADASEILVPESVVEAQIRRALGPDVDAARELSYVARRSGLLLPRKPGFFSFVHLSFQEYFAACHLYERLMGFDTREEQGRDVIKLAQNPVWHETLIFLFEKLSEHSGASDWLFRQLFPTDGGADRGRALLAAELLGDLHSGLSDESLERAAALVVSTGFELVSHALVRRLSTLPQGIGRLMLRREVERRLSTAEPPGAEGLLFLQILMTNEPDILEAKLAEGWLRRIEAKSLYYLHPLSWTSDGPVFRELVARLPIELWFVYVGDYAPLAKLEGREVPATEWSRENFLVWCGACMEIIVWLLCKIFLIALNTSRSEDSAATTALDRVRHWFRTRERDLPVLARHPVRQRDVVLALLSVEDQALITAHGIGVRLAGAYFLIRNAIRSNHYPDAPHVLAQAVQLGRNSQTSGRGGRGIAATFLTGRDELPPPVHSSASSAATPGLLILHHLGQLLLGRGGPGDLCAIQEQTKILADPTWSRAHLPFLRPGEMDTVLHLLGLRREDGEALFEAEWFATGHPLSPALNARPSEFAKRVDDLSR